MIRRPPRSTLFPYTSSSDLGSAAGPLVELVVTNGLPGHSTQYTDHVLALTVMPTVTAWYRVTRNILEQERAHLAQLVRETSTRELSQKSLSRDSVLEHQSRNNPGNVAKELELYVSSANGPPTSQVANVINYAVAESELRHAQG